jgi:DNA-binding MarR family transcriptional regulator
MNEQMTEQMAARLHSAAIKLLRMVRREDVASGISPPRLSALSVVVFAGPLSLAELAAAEQVRPPTMSRIVEALVREELVSREVHPSDRRSIRIAATDKGLQLLEAGRKRRVRTLTVKLRHFAESEQRALFRGIELLERLTQG